MGRARTRVAGVRLVRMLALDAQLALARDGTVFALSHPDAASSDMGDLSRSLQKHGLSSGKRLRVQLSGAGPLGGATRGLPGRLA